MSSDDLSQIGKLLDKKLSQTKDDVINEMVTFMEENLFPKFDRMAEKSDIERIERRIDSIAIKVGDQEVRLRDVETVSVIAHQLRVNKKK